MTRLSRTRTRVLSVSGPGSITNNGGAPTTFVGPYTTSKEECIDSYGTPWNDYSLSVGKGRFPRVHFNGTRVQSGITYTLHDVPMFPGQSENWTVTPWKFHNSIAGAKFSTNTLAAKALASANPNTPNIDLPVSIIELRELPQLLRDAGTIALNTARRKHAKASARANLAAQFGVAPVISDMLTLMDFVEKVAQRERYLRRLNSEKPVRIKRKITEQNWDTNFTHSGGLPLGVSSIKINYLTTSVYWFTMRAHLSVLMTERDIQTHAFKLVLGIDTVSVKQLWELLPWSWLIDWFSDVGDILAAYRNGIPFIWSNLNVMCRTEYKMSGTIQGMISTINADITSPAGIAVHKTRTPVPTVWAYPTLRIPYLSAKQWSILTSLAVLRL